MIPHIPSDRCSHQRGQAPRRISLDGHLALSKNANGQNLKGGRDLQPWLRRSVAAELIEYLKEAITFNKDREAFAPNGNLVHIRAMS